MERRAVDAVADTAVLRVVSPVLVGRARELEVLAATASAPPAVALVQGEAGIGKTRLIEELLRHPDLGGRRLLRGRCHRVREPFPLGAVLEALRGLQGQLADLAPSPVVGALRTLLPELAEQLPADPAPLGDPAADRHRVFRAVAELLDAAGPAVLVLEDLHWADHHTLELLDLLVSTASPALALVLTTRPDQASGLATLAARAPASTRVARLALDGLDAAAVGELTASILETDAVSPEFAGYLHERTGGLPFAVEEVLALLRERRTLVRAGGQWTRRALSELGVPGPIRDSILERAARTGPAARALIDAAAVLHQATSESAVAAVADLEGDAAADAAAEAITSGLLQRDDGVLGFRHVLAAEAVSDALPPGRQRQLHARAADALAALHPRPLGRLADHLRLAGRTHEWAAVAEEAADRATVLGHDAEAARLLLQLSRDAPLDRPARARVARKLGHAANLALAHDEATSVLRGILSTEDLEPEVRGDLRQLLSMLLYQAGDRAGCHQQLELAVAELEGHPASQVVAMSRLANVFIPGIDVAHNESWMRRSLDLLAQVDDPVLRTSTIDDAVALQVTIGSPTWRALLDRERIADDTVAQRRVLARGAHNTASTATYTGFMGDAERWLARAAEVSDPAENRRVWLLVTSAQAVLDLAVGRWEGLEQRLDALAADLVDLRGALVEVQVARGGLALARGDLTRASAELSTASELADRESWLQPVASSAAGLARIALARGDAAEAGRVALHAVEVLGSVGLWAAAGPAVAWAAEALVAAGQIDAAAAVVDRSATGLEGRDAPAAQAALTRSRGVLAAAAGDHAAAAEAFEAAAAAFAALPTPYQEALARERAAGAIAAAGGDPAAAVQQALAGFAGLGATWDQARCARTARRLGVSVPAPYRGGRRGYGTALSPRELEVARLAATGMANKEIAAELHLSPTTVGKHLGRAMRKLGVHSRTAVAATLARQEEAPAGHGG